MTDKLNYLDQELCKALTQLAFIKLGIESIQDIKTLPDFSFDVLTDVVESLNEAAVSVQDSKWLLDKLRLAE